MTSTKTYKNYFITLPCGRKRYKKASVTYTHAVIFSQMNLDGTVGIFVEGFSKSLENAKKMAYKTHKRSRFTNPDMIVSIIPVSVS